ncbi:MAG TPA: DedA family protein [Moorella mulderi]|nr:DedA family protein [Moorella mulderi]
MLGSWLQPLWNYLVNILASWGYWGIAIGMALESACIPIPSEVILPFGGYLVSIGALDFWGTVLAGTLGGTVGSATAYWIGLKGGRPLLERYGRYILISQRELAWADDWFQRYGEATVFFTRLMPVIRTFISLPAGIAAMPFGRFILYTFLGSLPWSVLFVYIGHQLGENWDTLSPYFHRFDLFIIAGILILIALYLYRQCRA